MEGVKEDIKSLFAKFNHDHKQLTRDEQQLNLKRRWLMGLTMSNKEEKQLKVTVFQNNRVMPELFLREDDVHCETIRSSIGKGLRVNDAKRELPLIEGIMQLHNSRKDIGRIFSLLNIMTTEALCRVAEILASGSVGFEKSCWKSRKIIKNCIAELLRNQNNCQYVKLSDQLSQLLKDPNNFLCDHVAPQTCASQSYCAAAGKVLDGLGDLHILTLHSMHRKLRGVKEYMPQLQPPRSGWRREKLIDAVRNRCIKMISKLREGDELPEPLVKAMKVACLGFKLIGNEPVQEFQHFSTEIEALQNKIMKAIVLLDLKKKVSISDLRKMKLLLDPRVEISNKSLRPAIRNLLTEYLLECNDMELIPECLNIVLNIITGGSPNTRHRSFTKAEVEEEVECVLSVSAQTKQIAWDLLPEHEFDEEFANAYVEDLEDSDDGEGWGDDKWQVEQMPHNRFQKNKFHLNSTNDQLEGVGETSSTNSKVMASVSGCSSPVNSMNRLECEVESICSARINSVPFCGSTSFSPSLKSKDSDNQGSRIGLHLLDETLDGYPADAPRFETAKAPGIFSSNYSLKESYMHDEQGMTRNQYLAVQNASDKTSLVAYQIIGNLLNAFAQVEGMELRRDDVSYLRGFNSVLKKFQDIAEGSVDPDSFFMQVLQELIPNFTKSGRERAKQLMALR